MFGLYATNFDPGLYKLLFSGAFFLRLQIFSCHKSEVKTKVAECVLIICNLIYQLVILVLMMVMMMLPNTNVF